MNTGTTWATKGKYAKGLRCAPSSQKKGGGRLVKLVARSLPSAAEVELGPVLDQGMASSCTGNAIALAIQARMPRVVNGDFAELGSRLFAYYHGRASENNISSDAGAMIGDVLDGITALGIPPESKWSYPTDPATLAQKVVASPGASAYRAAADQKIVDGWSRILSTGDALLADIKTAIVSGFPVVWGTVLDEAFEELGPTDVWPGVTGSTVGAHAMVLPKYDGDVFWTRSSWTDSFADKGSARISSAAITSPYAGEFYIISHAPEWSAT